MFTKTKTHNVPKALSRKTHNDSKSEDQNSARNTKRTTEKRKQNEPSPKLKQETVDIKKTEKTKFVKTNSEEAGSARKPLKTVPKVKTGKVSSPPSKRISKTQFFPSKNHYSEVLHELNKYKESIDGGAKKRTITSKKIADGKIRNIDGQNKEIENKDLVLSESSSISERPRTSTLRKGSIVNHNIAGPEVPKKIERDTRVNVEDTICKDDEVVEYEDDFDSYESDFENCSSSDSTIHDVSDISTEKVMSSCSSASENNEEEPCLIDKGLEKKLDSGNFDLGENKRQHGFVNNVEIVNYNIGSSNIKPMENNFKSNLTSLSDEGFEESKSLQFLNFAEARKKHDLRKSLEKRKKRGEELLSMIKLDHVNFVIFDLPPVNYETYIRRFGKLTSIQVGTQTDKDEVDDEMQTDDIRTCCKWVQMPPHISNPKSGCYKYDLKGVGPELDGNLEEISENNIASFNERKLEIFIANAGELILKILKEREPPSHRIQKGKQNELSNGFIQFHPRTEFLDKKKIVTVSFNPRNSSMFISVHIDQVTEENSRSIVCLWNVNDELPLVYMTCYGKVTSCCFGPDAGVVLAGLENGLLAVWETKNSYVNLGIFQFTDKNMRTPIFLTPIEVSHCCKVIALRVFLKNNTRDQLNFDKQDTNQLCSLDYEGDIIVWSLINKHRSNMDEYRHAPLENIILCKNFKISLRTLLPEMIHLICADIILPIMQSESALIGTNYGTILQCFLSRQRTAIKQFTSGDSSSVECLCACPFSQLYFLAAFKNGNISLYSRKNCKPLMVISNEEYKKLNAYCVEIRWSLEKPCMFYTRSSGNTIDVWDLSMSNILPIKSVSFNGMLVAMEPSPSSLERQHNNVFLMISTETTIYMHIPTADQIRTNFVTYQEEMKTFINYGKRL